MAKAVPAKFETDDGISFDTKEEAERHERLCRAKGEYDNAASVLGKATAETYKTADGEPFTFGLFRDYWRIIHAHGMPHLEHVTLMWSYDTTVSVEEGGGVIHSGGRDYRIEELYASEVAAKKALVKMADEDIADIKRRIDRVRDEVYPQAAPPERRASTVASVSPPTV